MKTRVITTAKVFPKGHRLEGEPTGFREKIERTINGTPGCTKEHTLRENVEYWREIIEEVMRGEAILSIREWEGVPRKSKQIEYARLTAADGVGWQELNGKMLDDENRIFELAANDGLCVPDFIDWFKNHDRDKNLIIIHFTNKRY